MKAIWTDPGLNDLLSALDRIAEDNPDAAIHFAEALDKLVIRLEQFPRSGRKGRIQNTYEAVIGAYILTYRIDKDMLLLTHFTHAARLYPPLHHR